MHWWWQQLSWKVSISLPAVLDWYFSPVDNFPPCKASFSTSFLFASRARGNRSLKCFHSSETLCQITAQTPMRISASWTTPAMYVHSSQPSCPLLLCFSCQTGYLHTVSSVSLCLPVIASVMMTNARTGLLASLYLVSSCYRCDWAEHTDRFLWSIRQKFRLSHKQLCPHCSSLWLDHQNILISDLGASFSFPLKWSTWDMSQGVVCSLMLPGLQGQYVALEVRHGLNSSRPEITLFSLHRTRCPYTYVSYFGLQ